MMVDMHWLRQSAKGGLQSLVEWVWPSRSLVSGDRGGLGPGVAPEELARLIFLQAGCRLCARPLEAVWSPDAVCPACLAKPPPWDEARAAVLYDEVSRPIVLNLKHGGRREGLEILCRWMVHAGRDMLDSTDYLVPVPLHYRRLVRRGFNQSAWLAQGVSRQTGRSLLVDGLVRWRHTPSQAGKTLRQRRRNVAGAFAVRPRHRSSIEGRRITLIDDVMTTGATARACCRALRQAGAQKINLLMLARVVRAYDVTI